MSFLWGSPQTHTRRKTGGDMPSPRRSASIWRRGSLNLSSGDLFATHLEAYDGVRSDSISDTLKHRHCMENLRTTFKSMVRDVSPVVLKQNVAHLMRVVTNTVDRKAIVNAGSNNDHFTVLHKLCKQVCN